MAQRISGYSFNVSLDGLTLTISKATLTIEDSTEVAKDGGIPNGHVFGEVGASGEVEIDAQGLSVLTEVAGSNGSWRAIPPFDALFYAKTGSGEEQKVEAFGCKFTIESLLDIDKNSSASKHVTKLKYIVTSPDFVRINDIPYLSQEETEGIVKIGE